MGHSDVIIIIIIIITMKNYTQINMYHESSVRRPTCEGRTKTKHLNAVSVYKIATLSAEIEKQVGVSHSAVRRDSQAN
jgi:hypothetical protein